MELIYRGIGYKEKKQDCLILSSRTIDNRIIYRGNSPKAIIKPSFPWLSYVKQLFKSKAGVVFDPITFWYDHKREFVKDCWRLGDVERLNDAWKLTAQMEAERALKSPHKIKLKYRGIVYYK
ncbi:MAG: DUF4278 domain-containing protein [Cyanobacteria bacterium P01_G01_bin.19]